MNTTKVEGGSGLGSDSIMLSDQPEELVGHKVVEVDIKDAEELVPLLSLVDHQFCSEE